MKNKNDRDLVVIIIFVAVAVSGILLLNSNNTKPAVENSVENSKQNTELNNIIWRKYLSQPEFSYSYKINKEEYIVSLVEGHLVVIKEEGGIWNEVYNEELLNGYSIKNETVKIDGKNYLYFENMSAGTGYTSVSFTLFSLDNFNIFKIDVSGPNGDVSDMEIDPSVQQNKEVREYLLKKVEKSDNVTHASDLDNNPNSPKNAELVFRTSNGDLRKKLEYAQPQKIITRYYKDNLFNMMGENSITSTIENSKYKVVSYFKASIIVFNKTKNMYFIAFTPSYKYDWVTKVEWYNDDETIVFINTNNEVFSIKLNTNEIYRIK